MPGRKPPNNQGWQDEILPGPWSVLFWACSHSAVCFTSQWDQTHRVTWGIHEVFRGHWDGPRLLQADLNESQRGWSGRL